MIIIEFWLRRFETKKTKLSESVKYFLSLLAVTTEDKIVTVPLHELESDKLQTLIFHPFLRAVKQKGKNKRFVFFGIRKKFDVFKAEIHGAYLLLWCGHNNACILCLVSGV